MRLSTVAALFVLVSVVTCNDNVRIAPIEEIFSEGKEAIMAIEKQLQEDVTDVVPEIEDPVSAQVEEVKGKCFSEQKPRGGLLGAFRARCDENGNYEKMQCREGYCYCVDPLTGDQIEGTENLERGTVDCEKKADTFTTEKPVDEETTKKESDDESTTPRPIEEETETKEAKDEEKEVPEPVEDDDEDYDDDNEDDDDEEDDDNDEEEDDDDEDDDDDSEVEWKKRHGKHHGRHHPRHRGKHHRGRHHRRPHHRGRHHHKRRPHHGKHHPRPRPGPHHHKRKMWMCKKHIGETITPKFCGKNKCPSYKLVACGWGYEKRCYGPSTWAMTKNTKTKDRKSSAFMKLFKYIQGNNDAKQKIKMTVPVLDVTRFNKTAKTMKSGMAFWLNVEKAPAPLDPLVKVHTFPGKCAFVRSFGGRVKSGSKQMWKQVIMLTKVLKMKKEPFAQGVTALAQYNSPWKMWGRHNEVWRWERKAEAEDEDDVLEKVEKHMIGEDEEDTEREFEETEPSYDPMDPITNDDEDTKEGPHVVKLEKSEYKKRRSLSKIWNTVKKWNPLTKITDYLEKGETKDMGKRKRWCKKHIGKTIKPRFCGKIDCPSYKIAACGNGYEKRCYGPLSWVTTAARELDEKSFSPQFKRLFAYIRGANDKQEKIEMTAPVLNMMHYNITDHKTAQDMSFWLNIENPPKPTDPSVKLYNSKAGCAYVRSFGGYVMSRSYWMYYNLYQLTKAMRADKINHILGESVYAGYDSPFKLLNRHNEVWRWEAPDQSAVTGYEETDEQFEDRWRSLLENMKKEE